MGARLERWLLGACTALLLLAGCGGAAAGEDWRSARAIGQAEQIAPPALVAQDGLLIAGWVGGASGRERVQLRRMADGDSGQPVVLDLAQRQARAVRAVAGPSGTFHLLWIDSTPDGSAELYSALVSAADLSVLRGPFALSGAPVFTYSAAGDDVGGAIIAWSGAPASEPAVRLRRIDRLGRPREQIAAIPSAESPTLLRLQDGLRLYWIGSRDRALYEGRVEDAAAAPRRITSSPHLDTGERLVDVRVGADAGYLHSFWNLAGADGNCETWHTASAIGGTAPHPERLLLPDEADSGAAEIDAVCYAAPLSVQRERLPIAAAAGRSVMLLIFEAGRLTDARTIAQDTLILAPPLLIEDDRRARWWLAWAVPTLAGYADLTLIGLFAASEPVSR